MGVLAPHDRGFSHIQEDKERQKRMESDIRRGLKDPESGEEAQTLGSPARDRWLPLPNRENPTSRNLELNLPDKRGVGNQICCEL